MGIRSTSLLFTSVDSAGVWKWGSKVMSHGHEKAISQHTVTDRRMYDQSKKLALLLLTTTSNVCFGYPDSTKYFFFFLININIFIV